MIQILAGISALMAAAIWGFAFVVVKDSLNSVSASYMLAIRFTIAAVIMCAIFAKKLRNLNRKYLLKGLVIGLFLTAAYLVQTIGCNYTTPGKNAFLTTFYVGLIPLWGWLVDKKRPAWFIFVAVVLQIAGIGFLSLGNDIKDGLQLNLGDWLTLLCAFFYCWQMFYQAKFMKNGEENDPLLYALIQFVVAAILSWIMAPFYDAEANRMTLTIQAFPVEAFSSSKFVVSVLYLGLGSTACAFALQNIGLKYLNSSLATILLSFESVFGMLFSVLIPVNGVRETLSVWGLLGCAMIFGAVLLAQREEKPE